MTLTREQYEKSICNFNLLISRAKQQGDTGLEDKYNEQLKLLELDAANTDLCRRIPIPIKINVVTHY
jgi:hypothetical protein